MAHVSTTDRLGTATFRRWSLFSIAITRSTVAQADDCAAIGERMLLSKTRGREARIAVKATRG